MQAVELENKYKKLQQLKSGTHISDLNVPVGKKKSRRPSRIAMINHNNLQSEQIEERVCN